MQAPLRIRLDWKYSPICQNKFRSKKSLWLQWRDHHQVLLRKMRTNAHAPTALNGEPRYDIPTECQCLFKQAETIHCCHTIWFFSIYKRGRVFTRKRGNGLHRLNITTLLLRQFATWVKSKHDQLISHGSIGAIVGKRDFASWNQIYEFSGRIFRIKFPWILAERVPTSSQLWLGLKWTVKVKSQTCITKFCHRDFVLKYIVIGKKGLSSRIGTFSGPFQGHFGN